VADKPDESEHLSVEDMRRWHEAETLRINKGSELRLKEVGALVDAYSRGEISGKEAETRMWKYDQRWGEALPGVLSPKGLSDEQILAAIDETRRPDFGALLQAKTESALRRQRPDSPETAR
jgi:hypothetical protein